MTTHYGDTAFPAENQDLTTGLTKREYFAGLALQGILAAYAGRDKLPTSEMAGAGAVGYADALIAALNGTGESS